MRRKLGYDLTPGSRGVWRAENTVQRIRISFSAEGVRVVPLSPGRTGWEWGFSLSHYGMSDDLRGAGYPSLQVMENRLEFVRGRVGEWFQNGPKGLEHGIEIPFPGEPGLFYLDFLLAGSLSPKVSEDGQRVEFRDGSGAPVLVYRELRGTDAEGRDVSVRWERREGPRDAGGDLRLVVQGSDQAFPIRIMGLLGTPKGWAGGPPRARAATEAAVLAVPVNDQCGGAEVIPGPGPFPYLSSVVDITDATTTGDPPTPSCQANVSHSVWFAFTPVTGTGYTFSVCAGDPTATTVEDTVLAIYSAAGSCTGLAEPAGGCDDDSCASGGLQSVISNITLAAGSTYYIVAWKFDSTTPALGAGNLQLQVVQHPPSGSAPANDLCSGSEVIPGAGPFPYLGAVTADISGATTSGDPPSPSCQANVSRSLWYSFTPAASGRYTFSVCADAPTGTTVDDTVMAIYSGSGACSGFAEVAGGCDDDSCFSEAGQSVIYGISLTAGTNYHIVVWQYGTPAPSIGNTAVQMRVSQVVAPPNDTCASSPVLSLDNPVSGTTVAAVNDTQLPAGSGCFTGIGQTTSTAPGADVAYRFTAPAAGQYSFRLSDYEAGKNAVLYVSTDCPSGVSPLPIAGCLGAANRTTASAEEVKCLPLIAGQAVHAYVDEHTATTGSAFTLEVNRCRDETEPNGAPAAAGEPACGMEGSIAPAGDIDFYTLGSPETGARVFAMVDGVAGNSTDFDLRVTSDVDTMEYDDLNNDVPFGTVAPNASGTRLNGTASHLRVTHYSAAAQAEPYRVYAAVQPPSTTATPEVEPNNAVPTATGAVNEYYSGRLSDAGDVDFFSFLGVAGELIQIGLDLDPTRDNTPFNGSLALLDSSGATLRLVNDLSSGSSTVPGTGSLTATTPSSPGEAIAYRIRSSGTCYVKVAWSGGTPGDYLLSISHDCRVSPPTDLAVIQTDTPDPVLHGGEVTYSVTVSNLGPHSASVVTLRDDLPAGSVFIAASPTQGTCTGSGPVICHLGTLGAGASARVSIAVSAPQASGPISNRARVTTAVVDTSPANDASSETTLVELALDGDGDGVPDASDCAPANAEAWNVPGEATGLAFDAGSDALLQWSPPSIPGGTVVYYDLLRSTTANSFLLATCQATNITATSATDSSVPATAFHYLVRARNACGGNLGTDSSGAPRVAGACP